MAIKHAIQPDATFSPLGQIAWEEEHVIEDATITPQKLDRVYLVVADLAPYQLTSQISTAAFRNEGYFSASSHASTHVTGGSDVIANFDATRSGLAPLSGTSTTLFLRGDGQWVAGAVAWGAITGTLSNQTDLQAALDAKAISSVVIAHVALANPHTQYQMVSSLSSAAFRDSSYFAASSVISSAAFRLDTYFVASSTISSAAFTLSTRYSSSFHASTHITGGADIIPSFNATSSGLSPLSGGGTTNFLRADGTWVAPGGGSDPWTYLKVSSQHYGTSSVAFVDIPGLRFTPGTNSTYEVEWHLMVKTSTAAVTPRIGVRWPTGTSSVGWINQGQTNSTQLFTWGNHISTMQVPAVGLLATTTAPWGVIGSALINALGGANSSFALQHATESTTVFVSTMIGSYLKYRTY